MKNQLYLLLVLLVGFMSCEPYQEEDISLPAPPAVPAFTVEFVQGDSNSVVVTDLSAGNFSRVWDFGQNANGDTPLKKTSTNAHDTVTYLKAGTYTITLHVSAENGGGTSQNSSTIVIEKDGTQGCDPTIANLTGDCLPAGKCWVFSQAAGAITVGPAPGDGSWFSSQAGGLAPEQYDDSFCFYLDGSSFVYNNNGATINPFNGYAAEPYPTPSDLTWTFSAGTGLGGTNQIILPVGYFLGVRDASNVIDIITLTETELVVRAPIVNEDGSPNSNNGWFELYFVAQ